MILIKTIGLPNWNLNFQKKLLSASENFANLTRINFRNWSVSNFGNFSKPNFRRNLEIFACFSHPSHCFHPDSWASVSASSSNQWRLSLPSEPIFWLQKLLKTSSCFDELGSNSFQVKWSPTGDALSTQYWLVVNRDSNVSLVKFSRTPLKHYSTPSKETSSSLAQPTRSVCWEFGSLERDFTVVSNSSKQWTCKSVFGVTRRLHCHVAVCQLSTHSNESTN